VELIIRGGKAGGKKGKKTKKFSLTPNDGFGLREVRRDKKQRRKCPISSRDRKKGEGKGRPRERFPRES